MNRELGLRLIQPFFPPEVRPLLEDPTISDLMIQEGKVFVDRDGEMQPFRCDGLVDSALMAAIETIARMIGKDITAEYPILDTRLPDGSRVAAVYPPCSPLGPTLTIRKFTRWYSIFELVEQGMLPPEIWRVVLGALQARKNVLISGGTSSGKTTLTRALLHCLPPGDRLVVIEKPMELGLEHENAVRWEAVDPLPGQAEVTVSQLVKAALRHRPDRIIVGEVRDEAAYDLLQAWNTGHGGSISTIHASGAKRALERMADLATAARPNLSPAFLRAEVAHAIHMVVHVERNQEGRREVKECIEVVGHWSEATGFATRTLYEKVGSVHMFADKENNAD